MRGGADPLGQLCLRPAKALRRPQIPAPLLQGEIRLQNDYILCPANPHGLLFQFGIIFVSAEELPHPAQVTGEETRVVRVCGLQIL